MSSISLNSGGGTDFSDLTHLVLPRSIALVGASDREDSIGGRALANLTQHSDFNGRLDLINPSKSRIAGLPCVPSVSELAHAPDVAIIAVRADAVMPTLEQCGALGVKFAIVLTSGFGEVDEAGKAIEADMRALSVRTGLRIYGPNCPGLNNINARLGMTFSPAFRLDLRAGPIGLATQGGGLGRTFLQSMDRGIGTGLWFSGGNEVDLEIADFVHYMADAPDIQVIATSIEGVRNGPRFMQACLHALRQGKPVVTMKVGKSEYGIKAAQSHTAAIAGVAEINSAVFRDLGVIEVDDMDELIDVAALLSRRQPTGREKLAVYCFSGGTAALSADKIGAASLTLATLSPDTRAVLAAQLPPYAAIDNPVDTTADVLGKPEVGYSALKAVCDDPSVDLVLYPFPIEYGTVTTVAAENAVRVQRESGTPIVTTWMSDRLGDGYRRLVDGGLMPMRSVGSAVLAIQRYVVGGRDRHAVAPDWQPLALSHTPPADTAPRHTLTETAGKAVLQAAGVTAPVSQTVTSANAAAQAFDALGGGPVVMKVLSTSITHKTEVGGVRLGVQSAADAHSAYEDIVNAVSRNVGAAAIEGVVVEQALAGHFVEVVVGIHRDPVFGPVCTFGSGGIGVELYMDVSRRLLPLDESRARAMIAETRCARLLHGWRGKPALDVDALVQALLRIGALFEAHADRIEELEINPLAVRPTGEGVVALDAVISWRGEKPASW